MVIFVVLTYGGVTSNSIQAEGQLSTDMAGYVFSIEAERDRDRERYRLVQLFWYFSTYQSLRRLPLLKFANSQYFPLAPFARFIGSLMRR